MEEGIDMAEKKQTPEAPKRPTQAPMSPMPNATAIPAASVVKERDSWKKAAFAWKARFDREHQRYISLDGIISEKDNEIQALYRRKNFDVAKMALEEELSDYAAHQDIQDVVKGKSGWNFKVTMEMVMLILGITFALELGFNQDFRDWMQINSTTVIVVAIAVVAMAFIFYSTAYRKKK